MKWLKNLWDKLCLFFVMPEPELVEPPKWDTTKFVVGFGPADLQVILNDEYRGEVHSVKWTDTGFEASPSPRYHGHMDICIFHETDPLSWITFKEDTELIIIYANEYGFWRAEEFVGLKFTHREGGASIDDIVQTQRLYFTAEDLKVDADRVENRMYPRTTKHMEIDERVMSAVKSTISHPLD